MKLLIPYSLLVFVVGCGAGVSSDPGTPVPPPDLPPGMPPTMTPTGPDKPPPPAAIYKRGSLAPTYRLTPNAEFPRFTIGGVQLQDSDFQVAVDVAATAAFKPTEIANQIAVEHGEPPT